MTLKQRIYSEIKSGKLAFKNKHEIVNLTSFIVGKRGRKEAVQALQELEAAEKIIRDRRGRYCTPSHAGVFTGVVRGNARGFAFLTPDDKSVSKADFFLPPHSLSGAYDGDKVLAAPVKGTKDEAYIVKILERGRRRIVGVFEKYGANAKVYADDEKLPDLFIPHALTMNAKNGDKVLCEITAYPQDKAPTAKVIEILGEGGDFDVEELSIIRAHGLYEEFPEDVLA